MDNIKKTSEQTAKPNNKNEQTANELQEQNYNLKKEIEKWHECAKTYAFKLKDAYKGHLMIQGVSEQAAENKSREILQQYKNCLS